MQIPNGEGTSEERYFGLYGSYRSILGEGTLCGMMHTVPHTVTVHQLAWNKLSFFPNSLLVMQILKNSLSEFRSGSSLNLTVWATISMQDSLAYTCPLVPSSKDSTSATQSGLRKLCYTYHMFCVCMVLDRYMYFSEQKLYS